MSNRMVACLMIFIAWTTVSSCAESDDEVSTHDEHIAHANEFAKLKLYHRALEELNRALSQNPESARAYKVRGNVYFAMGDYTKALGDFDQLLILSPANAESYIYHSIANSALENFQSAIDDINHALSIAPRSKSVKEARDKIFRKINGIKSE